MTPDEFYRTPNPLFDVCVKESTPDRMIDGTDTAFGPVIGHRIVRVRMMTGTELDRENWGRPLVIPLCLELENGTILIPGQDYEGSGPGTILGSTKAGESFDLVPA